MARSLKRLEMELRELVMFGVRQGTPAEIISLQVSELLRRASLTETMQADLLKTAQTDFAWLSEHSITPADRGTLAEILKTTANAFAKIGGRINDRVVRAVDRGLREGLRASEIENLVAHAVRGTAGNVQSITKTAIAAFDQAAVFRDATPTSRYRYVGPPAERAFCQKQLALAKTGKVYTQREIGQLNNGQGLSVLHHCGGWGCHHSWEQVVV